jgi:hypothetical protein
MAGFHGLFSQNFQLHYDFGNDRKYFTSTVEMFRPDSFGSTFLFVDMDYDPSCGIMSLAYFEIARYITLPVWNRKLDVSAQFNDGIADFGGLGQAWLFGLSYPVDIGFMEMKTDLLVRAARLSENKVDVQVTLAWYKPFLKDKLLFTGFFDVWSEKREGEQRVAFLGEPQLWWNTWKHLSLGSEVELSYHFLPSDDVELMPTLGFKWDF